MLLTRVECIDWGIAVSRSPDGEKDMKFRTGGTGKPASEVKRVKIEREGFGGGRGERERGADIEADSLYMRKPSSHFSRQPRSCKRALR